MVQDKKKHIISRYDCLKSPVRQSRNSQSPKVLHECVRYESMYEQQLKLNVRHELRLWQYEIA